MTEDEAKTKWCPMYRDADGSFKEGRCIASECMVWRWGITQSQAAEINAQRNAGAVASGYCGLAK